MSLNIERMLSMSLKSFFAQVWDICDGIFSLSYPILVGNLETEPKNWFFLFLGWYSLFCFLGMIESSAKIVKWTLSYLLHGGNLYIF